MTVQFRHAAELEVGGTGAYLRLLAGPQAGSRVGGLLQLNARGEPAEFTYSHVPPPDPSFWDPERLATRVLAELCAALFRGAQRSPLLLLYLADEVPPGLLEAELQLTIPVGGVIRAMARGGTEADLGRSLETPAELPRVRWHPAVPAEGSTVGRLLAALTQRRLLLEPFDRIPAGLASIPQNESATWSP